MSVVFSIILFLILAMMQVPLHTHVLYSLITYNITYTAHPFISSPVNVHPQTMYILTYMSSVLPLMMV